MWSDEISRLFLSFISWYLNHVQVLQSILSVRRNSRNDYLWHVYKQAHAHLNYNNIIYRPTFTIFAHLLNISSFRSTLSLEHFSQSAFNNSRMSIFYSLKNLHSHIAFVELNLTFDFYLKFKACFVN